MNLRQQDGDYLCEFWDRYKELLRICPHHGLEEWIIIQTLYDGLNGSNHMSINVAACDTFVNRSVDNASIMSLIA
jgi:hypothetical protein